MSAEVGQFNSIPEALTFDDITLVPQESAVLPREVDLSTEIVPGIKLSIPIISAAMDTLTEEELAASIARRGGLGVIHSNLSIKEQADKVRWVKRSQAGVVLDPFTISPDATLADANELMAAKRISGLPVVDKKSAVVGIITRRDLEFEEDYSASVASRMSKKLVTAPVGIKEEQAIKIFRKKRVEKLLIINSKNRLHGMMTVTDFKKQAKHPNATRDSRGRLQVGAAVSVSPDFLKRAAALAEAEVDVFFIDSAHGHSAGVLNAVRKIKKAFPNIPIVGGNIATYEGAIALAYAGVSAVKVGIGPGSICTTRVVTGVGVPQVYAVMQAAKGAKESGIKVIADGGAKYTGDITKILAVGADAAMLGGMLAGVDEAPGEFVRINGEEFKLYRGMGSEAAMLQRAGSRDRYRQGEDLSKIVPEGIEGRVPRRGPLKGVLLQIVGGVQSGLGYLGAPNIEALHEITKRPGVVVRLTQAGKLESHPHDVIIAKEAPNYRRSEV